jgi:hypothetical protein
VDEVLAKDTLQTFFHPISESLRLANQLFSSSMIFVSAIFRQLASET